MRKLLFFDVETTGLPTSYYIDANQTEHWPHVVQIAWIVTDYFGKEISHKSYIIKPENWEIPIGASRIHKITQKKALESGVDAREVFVEFEKLLDEVDYIIAHNIEFDRDVMLAEFYRYNLDADKLENKETFCTMESFTDYCAIERRGQYKYPKLEELHKKVMGTEMPKKHDAVADVYATKLCFFELKKQQVFEFYPPKEWERIIKEREERRIREQQEEQKRKERLREIEYEETMGCFRFLLVAILVIIFGIIFWKIL